MIGSSALKINEISSSLVVAPSDTSGDEILIVGDVPSYDQLNSELLLFLFPALSIKLSNRLCSTVPLVHMSCIHQHLQLKYCCVHRIWF